LLTLNIENDNINFISYFYIKIENERREKVKKRSAFIFMGICLFSLNFDQGIVSANAYTDLSTYKIKTGKFENKKIAETSLKSLKEETGWYASIQKSGSYQNYYEVSSGGFKGEDRVKEILSDFETTTKIDATYEAIGETEKYFEVLSGGFNDESRVKAILQDFKKATGINAEYFGVGESVGAYQILSGGFKGESRVKDILRDFERSTGLNATYEGIGEPLKYYEIRSGAFTGETRIKQVLKEFEGSTGINATYEGVGEPQKYYELVTGGFKGESRVIQILKDFENATGIDAAYIHAGNDSYKISTTSILGTTDLRKVQNFFKSNGWWFRTAPTGKTGYEKFRIKSSPLLELEKVNVGRDFFKRNGWNVNTPQTDAVGYERYRIVSEPITGTTNINKVKSFFEENDWSYTSKKSEESAYKTYKIKTEPLSGYALVNRAKGYFTDKNWYVNSKEIGQKNNSTYRIKTEPILGVTKVNKARSYFTNNDWFVTYSATGEKAPYFEILTGGLTGYEKAQASIKKINNLFGWSATAVKTENGPQLMYTNYGLTLNSMVDAQMYRAPQTDKYRNEARYVSAAYVDLEKQVITGDSVNLRTSPSLDGQIVQKLNTGDGIMVIGKTGDWVEVRLTWQNALAADVKHYLDPSNFSLSNEDYFQFLKLSQSANLNATEVNTKILNGKGILAGKGQAFIDAAKKYNINDVYLISHALLETGNGSSTLANGVIVNGKIVYNMYGYGAADSCPVTCGAQKAYDNGWFTPEAAIIGGAQFISNDYIYNKTFQQDTLYKMRWNPVQTWHQYATDIGWAYKQVDNIYNLYQLLDNYTLYYDLPKYQ
jgi:mannosyl-glycoprotein endo-beta-N-acetylglucosaminidase